MASTASSGMDVTTCEFHRFLDLATELQDMIWDNHRPPPRTIQIKAKAKFTHSSRLPMELPIFQVNRASRAYFLSKYTLLSFETFVLRTNPHGFIVHTQEEYNSLHGTEQEEPDEEAKKTWLAVVNAGSSTRGWERQLGKGNRGYHGVQDKGFTGSQNPCRLLIDFSQDVLFFYSPDLCMHVSKYAGPPTPSARRLAATLGLFLSILAKLPGIAEKVRALAFDRNCAKLKTIGSALAKFTALQFIGLVPDPVAHYFYNNHNNTILQSLRSSEGMRFVEVDSILPFPLDTMGRDLCNFEAVVFKKQRSGQDIESINMGGQKPNKVAVRGMFVDSNYWWYV